MDRKKVEPLVLYTAADHSDTLRERGRDRGEKVDESIRLNLNWSLWVFFFFFFLYFQGLLVKAAFRVTGLAPSASAVIGNYKQAKCVTCPNAVAESPRGHRAHAGWLAAGRNACAPFYSPPPVLQRGTTNSAFTASLLHGSVAAAGELKSKLKNVEGC